VHTARAPVVSLIGRARDLEQIRRAFAEGAQLVTLLGPGGIGKTTLAAAYVAVREAERASPSGDSIVWCDLTNAASPSALTSVVVGALGWGAEEPGDRGGSLEAVGRRLARRRRILVVLDNCDELADAAAAALRVWLAQASRARFLVTSRVALGIAEEHTWAVEGLPQAAAAADEASEALQLFLRGAAKVRPGETLSDKEREVAAEIVRRLEGWPLAIELAAARTRTLALPELLQKLDRPLDVLGRSRDSGRHRSIREIVLATVRLLDDDARRVFGGTWVFRGGFSRAAAAAVLPGGRERVESALDRLCEASLVRRIAASGETARYDLFEPIREVARELSEADRDTLASAHARHYAALAAEALGSAAHAPAHFPIGEEVDNALAAHAHLAETDAPATLVIARALDPVLTRRGVLRLRVRLLADAVATVPDDAEGQLAHGRAQRDLGELAVARSAFERAVELARAGGDTLVEARAILHLGELVEISGHTDVARGSYQRALSLLAGMASSPDVSAARAEVHAYLGHALRREGALDAAEIELTSALAFHRERQAAEGIASACYELAVVAMFRARRDEARAWFDDGLALAQKSGSRLLEAAIRSGRGVLVQECGDLDAAIGDHVAAVETFRDLGYRHREASAMYYLASAYVERGDFATADALIGRAVALAETVGAARYVALLHGLAGAADALRGRGRIAQRHFDEAGAAARSCERERALIAALAIYQLLADPDPAVLDRAAALGRDAENDDTRLARRLLVARARAGAAQPFARVRVAPDGSRLELGGSEAIDLSRRAPLRRLLVALARQRLDSPGEPLGPEDLVEAGWPGENIRHEAAVNRLHVALTSLRQLGLRELLLTGQRGYFLDPAVSLAFTAGGDGPSR
jgi:predicted ATPase